MINTLLGTLVNVALLWVLSRRILPVPVGWGRTLVLSFVVNALAFPMAELVLAESGGTIDEHPVQLTLLAAVIAAGVLTAQLVTLTFLEAIIPTASVPSLTTTIREFPAMLRRIRRYVALWWISLRHGLVGHLGAGGDRSTETSRVAASVRRALTRAGVTFVKLGQMLSTRSDLLPAPFVAELSKLQSEVGAEPWDEIEQVLADSLPVSMTDAFAHIDTTPLAAASVAQIHAATLTDGTAVVVKVQRPRARAQATADLDIISHFAARLEQRTRWGARIGIVSLAAGFKGSLLEELDYRVELANMAAVAAAHDAVRVPRPHPELSSEKVLVMERLVGQPLSRAVEVVAAMPHERRGELADDLFSAVLHQVLVTGVFHADLHPGNIFLTDDGLALLDFGSVGRLDKNSRTALGMVLLAIDREDAIAATDALIDLLDRPANLDDKALEREVGQLMLRFGDGLGTGGSTEAFTELLGLVMAHGFRVPPQLAAAFRALAALEGSLRLLDPNLDLVSLMRAHGGRIMAGQLQPGAVRTALEDQLATLLPLAQRLPRRISRIAEQLEDGTLVVNVGPGMSPADAFTREVQQLSTSLLAAAAGLGGVLLVSADGGPGFLPNLSLWPFLGLAFLLVALVLGTRILISAFHRQA